MTRKHIQWGDQMYLTLDKGEVVWAGVVMVHGEGENQRFDLVVDEDYPDLGVGYGQLFQDVTRDRLVHRDTSR